MNVNYGLIVCVLDDIVVSHLIYNVEKYIVKYYGEFISLDDVHKEFVYLNDGSNIHHIVHKKIHIISLAVNKKYGNKKIATEIIKRVFDLYNFPHAVIYFHVSIKNIVALNIYIKYGFKIIDVVKN